MTEQQVRDGLEILVQKFSSNSMWFWDCLRGLGIKRVEEIELKKDKGWEKKNIEVHEGKVGERSRLRRYGGAWLSMNNEPFGQWKTSGEGFGR